MRDDVIFMWVFLATTIMFLAIFVICHLYACVYALKLNFYLKKNNRERWRWVTSMGSMGPGIANPFRGISYIHSDMDEEDEQILRLKNKLRLGLRGSLISLTALIINIAIFSFVLVLYVG